MRACACGWGCVCVCVCGCVCVCVSTLGYSKHEMRLTQQVLLFFSFFMTYAIGMLNRGALHGLSNEVHCEFLPEQTKVMLHCT